MGYNDENARRVVLDLETVAIDGAGDLCEPVSAPANYKDPAKIAAYIEEAQKAQAEKAALYPWTARIVALGLWAEDDREPLVVRCETEQAEAEALRMLWQRYRAAAFVTFNGRTFDLPVLLARSALLGVPHPVLNLDRYRSPHVDLMETLTWRGAIPARSLKWFAKRFGLPVHDDHGGADVARLVAEGQWQAVAEHCLSDVTLTRAVAERMGLVRQLAEVA
jgi:predicted PolB exonuclease-like 3'-5' exonuclease